MLQFLRRYFKVSGLLGAVLIMGCGEPATVTVEQESVGLQMPSIAQMMRQTVAIQDLSPAQNNSTVQIEGTVTRQASLLKGSLYQLQDDTGTIWIVSEEPEPEASAVVQVAGTLKVEPITVEGIDISDFYLRETARQVVEAGSANVDETQPADSAPPAESADEENTP